MTLSSMVILSALILMLASCITAQGTQCATDGSPQLRFQLSVRGCPIFVHDTGASDGPHLAVEPIMCVTESLLEVTPQYDPVTLQTYVSVPVTLRDDVMLTEAQRQLRYLSPKSVKFATVSDISISTYASSEFQALGFDWTHEKSTGILKLGCQNVTDDICAMRFVALWSPSKLPDILRTVQLSAIIEGAYSLLSYIPTIQNRCLSDADVNGQRNLPLPICQQVRFARSILLNNCTARVYETQDKGNFLIEPLFCPNITSMRSESVMYDSGRDMHYLKLDYLMQHYTLEYAAKTELADLSPISATFMQLLRAQVHLSSALSRRFEIDALMVAGSLYSVEKFAQLRVYCKAKDDCIRLRQSFLDHTFHELRLTKWSVTSMFNYKCIAVSDARTLLSPVPFINLKNESVSTEEFDWARFLNDRCQMSQGKSKSCKFLRKSENRTFVVIQQRQTGSLSFQRGWVEYETGFGDNTDFWIGLKAINSLTDSYPRLLRVEAVTWAGKTYVCEYSGFRVGDASTAYNMTFDSVQACNTTHESLGYHRGYKFSTFDRDHSDIYCSIKMNGRGGWWFWHCANINPNGIYQATALPAEAYNIQWYGADGQNALRSIRLMLEI